MKYKKMYSYKSVNAGIVFYFIFLFLIVLILIFNPRELWFMSILIIIFILIGIYAISVGITYPIQLNEKGLIYRGKEYNWDNIRITAYQIHSRGIYSAYLLLFGESYLDLKTIKSTRKKGFYVYLMKKPLLEILNYYKYNILILDYNGIMSEINSSKQINQLINEHNKNTYSFKYDKN